MSTIPEIDLEKWERNVDVDSEPEEGSEASEDLSEILDSIRAEKSDSAIEQTADSDPSVGPAESEAPPADDSAKTTSSAGEANASTDSDAAEEQRRKEHEEAEAKRKAEWEAKQAEKRRKEQEELARIATMSDEDVMASAAELTGLQTEKLTRRNMKILVTSVVQAKCREDPAFARLVMNPKKNMSRCFLYINRHARKYIEDEMKANGEEMKGGMIGSDVPDDVCYQWALDYFRDANAEEDKERDEKFVSKPYVGSGRRTTKKTEKKKPEPKPVAAKKQTAEGQISLGDMLGAA